MVQEDPLVQELAEREGLQGMIITTSRGTKDRKGYTQISVSLLSRRVKDFALKCKVFPPTFPDQRENVRMAHVVTAHICAFAILIGTCGIVWSIWPLWMPPRQSAIPAVCATHTNKTMGTKDCFKRHFPLPVSMSANQSV